ncbi:MAG: type II toxin-antitoxin system Phd/YefM family antitoxin [Cellulophaga sp.]
MEAIGISELRKNIKITLDKVINDGTEIIIHRPNQEDVLMVSLDEYNSLVETLELMSSKKNRDRLYLGMEQVNDGKTTKISLNEL